MIVFAWVVCATEDGKFDFKGMAQKRRFRQEECGHGLSKRWRTGLGSTWWYMRTILDLCLCQIRVCLYMIVQRSTYPSLRLLLLGSLVGQQSLWELMAASLAVYFCKFRVWERRMWKAQPDCGRCSTQVNRGWTVVWGKETTENKVEKGESLYQYNTLGQ